jgi:hypothetical protein
MLNSRSSGIREMAMFDRVAEVLQSEERRAKKVESLIALFRDPDLQDVVARLTASTPMPASVHTSIYTAAPVKPMRRSKPAKRSKKQPYSNGVTAKLRSIGPQLPRPFTVPDVVDLLAREEFRFPSNRVPKEAVRDALYFMVKDEDTYRVVEQGGAGKHGKYEFMVN